MLEIVIASIALLAAFIGVAWYALRSSKRRRNQVLDELNERISIEAVEAFNVVFEEEVAQQLSDSQLPDIDSDPVISQSEEAQKIEVVVPERKLRNNSIYITIDDTGEELIELQKGTESTIIDRDMVIVFTVLAPEGQRFSGLDLKVAFENLNFEFGELGIYHRMAVGVRNTPLFSVANIVASGTFDPQDITAMATSGILLFAKIPGPVNGLTLFDDFLETAQSLTHMLSGTLCDESRETANQNTFERMRSRILELNLSIQLEQHQYGNNDYSN